LFKYSEMNFKQGAYCVTVHVETKHIRVLDTICIALRFCQTRFYVS